MLFDPVIASDAFIVIHQERISERRGAQPVDSPGRQVVKVITEQKCGHSPRAHFTAHSGAVGRLSWTTGHEEDS